jgi:hypothetical protein
MTGTNTKQHTVKSIKAAFKAAQREGALPKGIYLAVRRISAGHYELFVDTRDADVVRAFMAWRDANMPTVYGVLDKFKLSVTCK